MLREDWENAGNGKQRDSVRKEIVVVSDTLRISVQNRHRRPLLPEPLTERDGTSNSRRRGLRGRSHSGKIFRPPCRNYTKGWCTNPSLWLLASSRMNRDVNLEIDVRSRTGRLRNSPAKNRNRKVTKVQWLFKNTRQVGCVFQDAEPPKSSSILRKSTRVLRPTRRVQFSKATLLHANRESNGPSLGIICPANPCERSVYAPKFEDRSQDERDKSDAPADACRMSKSILKRKEKDLLVTYRGVVPASTIRNKTGGKRVRFMFRNINQCTCWAGKIWIQPKGKPWRRS